MELSGLAGATDGGGARIKGATEARHIIPATVRRRVGHNVPYAALRAAIAGLCLVIVVIVDIVAVCCCASGGLHCEHLPSC